MFPCPTRRRPDRLHWRRMPIFGLVYIPLLLFVFVASGLVAYVGLSSARKASATAGGMLLGAGAIEAVLVLIEVLVRGVLPRVIDDPEVHVTMIDVAVPTAALLQGIALVLVAVAARDLARKAAR